LAVSGGQDSVALLRLLLDLQPHWYWTLQVVHCDHGWRPDSGQNASFVADLCQGWGVPCQVIQADQPRLKEAEARQWRYGVLGEVVTAGGGGVIVTGHSASDRAETLLYNLIRGSGSDGLQALGWSRPLSPDQPHIQLVRPLLALTRDQIASFCQRFALPVWQDSTNQDLRYARNRLRLTVLPDLRRYFNPQVDRTLAQTAEVLRAEASLLEDLATDLYRRAVTLAPEEPGYQLHRPTLPTAPLALQRRVLRRVLGEAIAASPNFDRIETLVNLLQAPHGSRSSSLPGGLQALVAGDWLVLSFDSHGEGT
jgi:tRNA(Ile)-lysidine synthase